MDIIQSYTNDTDDGSRIGNSSTSSSHRRLNSWTDRLRWKMNFSNSERSLLYYQRMQDDDDYDTEVVNSSPTKNHKYVITDSLDGRGVEVSLSTTSSIIGKENTEPTMYRNSNNNNSNNMTDKKLSSHRPPIYNNTTISIKSKNAIAMKAINNSEKPPRAKKQMTSLTTTPKFEKQQLPRSSSSHHHDIRSNASTEATSSLDEESRTPSPPQKRKTITTTTARCKKTLSLQESRIPRFILNNPDLNRTTNSSLSEDDEYYGNVNNISISSSNSNPLVGDNRDVIIPTKLLYRSQPLLWKYASNHVMVNEERVRCRRHPLIRLKVLDELARIRAEQLAYNRSLSYASTDQLWDYLCSSDDNFVGKLHYNVISENICKGTSIRDIHKAMLSYPESQEYKNMINKQFVYMGMASVLEPLEDNNNNNNEDDEDYDIYIYKNQPPRMLYICQIFVG